MSTAAPDDGVLYEEQVEPQPGILGMTLRELLIVACWVIGFVVSFFPVGGHGAGSLWQSGLHWILPIAVPTVAVFLIVLRRFSPEGIRRIGSLGVDQFASVAFSVSALLWVQLLWDLGSASASAGAFLIGWSPIVETIMALALVVLTVLAPLVPGLREDFQGRLETLAHRNANPVRPVIAPARADRELLAIEAPVHETQVDEADAEAAEVAEQEEDFLFATGPDAVTELLTPDEDDQDLAETPDEETHPADDSTPADATQPFWILTPDAREVLDEHGRELFTIGPHAWALVIDDRGGAYVIRHDDGRIGYLHDITNITKG
ncbi:MULTISPECIES: hypothetical protein [unclassified Microbacterium]|uniref:hypothetical protein n=1 Tax=unclassified Microbacterium TaxID=2609290 RepID=UPI0012F7F094|nr:hypothetical protein [Microbacterium sp. MAH-37]MVQ43213.1 hypothetical protein [Microbacterium sp. MAH-37]